MSIRTALFVGTFSLRAGPQIFMFSEQLYYPATSSAAVGHVCTSPPRFMPWFPTFPQDPTIHLLFLFWRPNINWGRIRTPPLHCLSNLLALPSPVPTTRWRSCWRDRSSSQTATCSSGIANEPVTVAVAATVATTAMMEIACSWGAQQATRAAPGCRNRIQKKLLHEHVRNVHYRAFSRQEFVISSYLHHRRHQWRGVKTIFLTFL